MSLLLGNYYKTTKLMFGLLTESQKVLMAAMLQSQISVKKAGLRRLSSFDMSQQALIIQTEAETRELELQLKSLK